jgi:hypothetical protein
MIIVKPKDHQGYFEHFSLSEKMATFTRFWQTDCDMTAIVSVYTQDGFIVGADGLRISTRGDIVSTSAQKLFPISDRNAELIYGWSGTTQFFGHDGQCIFDFLSQTEPLMRAACLYAHTDFAAFLRFICTGWYVLLMQSKLTKGGDTFPIKLDREIARLLIAGYFKGEPCVADIGVRHDNGTLTLPVVQRMSLPLQASRDVFSGSKTAFEPFKETYPQNRDDAVNFVRSYIQACVDKPDPGQSYGGHIHIAELDPSGFRWIIAPQMSNSPTTQ